MSAARVRLLAIVAAVTAVVACSVVEAATVNSNVFTVSPDKDSKCHSPVISSCNSSLYPIMDYIEAGWFFHAAFKSCRPLYTAGGVHSCVKNMDLPMTKTECEDLCGEPCSMGNGTQGICMLEEFCKPVGEKSSAHPRPCGVYNVKCCPPYSKPAAAVVTKSGTLLGKEQRPFVEWAPIRTEMTYEFRPNNLHYEHVTAKTPK
ncbi:Hypothetical protein CINCED_3A014764 [Cinara cedri]|uniref:Uncharacterized protein n=1 Tax=Cinara cedri TaxID=506608 RepID=A0A5E4MMW5_9HEMI|nr:Hypothetical protein CINCED_3A014764 [Cinara cedri]